MNISNTYVKYKALHDIHLSICAVLFTKQNFAIAFESLLSLSLPSTAISSLRSTGLCLASPSADCFEIHLCHLLFL